MPTNFESDFNTSLGDMIKAVISQKLEGGYVLDLGGKKVFARSTLDLDLGDLLKLKIIESSPSQLVLKVIEFSKNDTLPKELPLPFNLPNTSEIHGAFNLLSKLNLPITQERIELIVNLFKKLETDQSSYVSPFNKETLSQGKGLVFHKFFSQFTHNDTLSLEDIFFKIFLEETNPMEETTKNEIANLENTNMYQEIDPDDKSHPMENTRNHVSDEYFPSEDNFKVQANIVDSMKGKVLLRKKPPFESHIKKEDNPQPFVKAHNKDTHLPGQLQGILMKQKSLKKQELNNTTKTSKNPLHLNEESKDCEIKPEVVKKFLSFKALNLAYKTRDSCNISFFPFSVPIYDKIILKVTKDSSSTSKEKATISLSFIVNTYNLGPVLVSLMYKSKTVSASITFEKKEYEEKAKNMIKDLGENVSQLIKTLNLGVGVISQRDFLFPQDTKTENLQGIDVII